VRLFLSLSFSSRNVLTVFPFLRFPSNVDPVLLRILSPLSSVFLSLLDTLPISPSALHFSDTSGASKSSSAAVTKDAYTDGINKVFTATTVPGLCGSLKAYKEAVKSLSKRVKPEDGLGLYRAGMNLHFFRTGISPTWEDAYNAKVRLRISLHTSFPSLSFFTLCLSFIFSLSCSRSSSYRVVASPSRPTPTSSTPSTSVSSSFSPVRCSKSRRRRT
jgi:hypothetical protein